MRKITLKFKFRSYKNSFQKKTVFIEKTIVDLPTCVQMYFKLLEKQIKTKQNFKIHDSS